MSFRFRECDDLEVSKSSNIAYDQWEMNGLGYPYFRNPPHPLVCIPKWYVPLIPNNELMAPSTSPNRQSSLCPNQFINTYVYIHNVHIVIYHIYIHIIISYHIIPYDKYHNMVIYAVIYIYIYSCIYIYIKWGMICFHAESINRSTRRSCWSFTFAWDLRRSKAALPSARWKASLSKEWVNVVNLWGGLGLWHLPPGKLTAGPWKSPIVNGN